MTINRHFITQPMTILLQHENLFDSPIFFFFLLNNKIRTEHEYAHAHSSALQIFYINPIIDDLRALIFSPSLSPRPSVRVGVFLLYVQKVLSNFTSLKYSRTGNIKGFPPGCLMRRGGYPMCICSMILPIS